MRGAQLGLLLDASDSRVGAALEIVAGFDEALVHGLARLTPASAGALRELAAAAQDSALGAAAGEAVAKLAAGSIGAPQLAALAAVRAGLLGAVHDTLLERLDGALGRERAGWAAAQSASRDAASSASAAPPAGVHEAARAWLQELAISGWRGVSQEQIGGADRPVEALLADPAGRRLAVLLDGFAAELRSACPLGAGDRAPVRRWADLWMRAMLLTFETSPAEPCATEPVSGRLLPLGVDVLEHGTAVQAVVYCVLERTGSEPRLVRTSVTAAKTDTIAGVAAWRLLSGYPRLLAALAEHKCLDVRDLPCSADGHLRWDEAAAELGPAADPFATARVQLAEAVAAPVSPLNRHPVQLSEPVFFEGHRVKERTLTVDGRSVEVEADRLPAGGPLTPVLVRSSTACIGLLRWEGGGWLLRPLAVQAKSKGAITSYHGGDWALGPTDPKVVKSEAKTGDPVAVLRERAGRLLRR